MTPGRPALVVDGLANIRDLGGLPRADGSTTPHGVFVRAEMLDRLDASGWRFLREYGVRTIVDLRRPTEVTGIPLSDMVVVHVDLDGDERDFWDPVEADGRWGTPLYYNAHLRELPRRVAAVLAAIAEAREGAVLFHCGAGWDRTGLLAAVLLKAIDATEDAAVTDYLASFGNAAAMSALHGRSFFVEERHAVLTGFGHTPESAFRLMYRELDLERWFRAAGIAEDVRQAIETWRGHAPSAGAQSFTRQEWAGPATLPRSSGASERA